MTRTDIDEVKRVLKEGVQEAVVPLQLEATAHRIVLFGPDGKTGISGAVRDHEAAIISMRLSNAKMAAMYSMLAAGGGLVGSILVKVIFK